MKNTEKTTKHYIYEKKTKFSQSKIWSLQRNYFEQVGIEAWSNCEVPHYVTSNPAMAKTYAELALAFLRDLALDGALEDTVYLVELGAGHGRFCYHFMKYFLPYYNQSSVKLPPFCYVISDFVEKNIKFWENHHQLSEFVNDGYLDFASFDAEKDCEIRLWQSGRNLSPHSLAQPLIVIANYFFDTIPQEMFCIKNGSIQQALLEITAKGDVSEVPPAKAIEGLQFDYYHQELEDNPYQEPCLRKLLESYQATLAHTHLLFPDVAIRCIERLRMLSQQGLMLLKADKGSHWTEELEARPAPLPVVHGSFSLPVNYHAFKQHCLAENGLPLFCSHSGYSLTMGTLIYMQNPEYRNETIQAYERFVEAFSPDDFFSLKKTTVENLENIGFPEIMGMLRLSGYDARFFRQLLPRIYDFIQEIDFRGRHDLCQVLGHVWNVYFDLGESIDMALEIALLLFSMELYQEATRYFEFSNQTRGVSNQKLESLLVCYCRIEDYQNAQKILERLRGPNKDHSVGDSESSPSPTSNKMELKRG